MECAICFHEFQKFKSLECSHFFCEKCVQDLADGRVVLAPPSTESTKTKLYPAVAEKEVPQQKNSIECPKCRQITELGANRTVNSLKSKFFGTLRCYQCDEDKTVSEFRWCHDCLISVCSACFVDKHTKTTVDGSVGLHTASKWEDYHAVEFCLSQIKLEENNAEKMVENAQKYVKSYLQGLEEFLCHELEQKAKSYLVELQDNSKHLAAAFGLNLEQVLAAKDQNLSYQYVLPDLRRLTGLKECVATLQSVEGGCEYHVKSIPYKEIGRHLLSNSKQSFEPKFLDPRIVRERAQETFVLGGNLIKNASDICLISPKTLVITDFEAGIFLFKNRCVLQGPIPLKHGYHNYANVSPLPSTTDRKSPNDGGKRSVLVNVNFGAWGFIVVTFDENKEFAAEHVKIRDSAHWKLPSNDNLSTAASGTALFALSSRRLFKLRDFDAIKPSNDPEWMEVYSVVQSNPQQYKRLGPILEKLHCSEVFLINTAWKAVDIVSVGHDNALWGIRRIEIPMTVEHIVDPTLSLCGSSSEMMFLADRKKSHIFAWNISGNGNCEELCHFRYKTMQKILFSEEDRVIYLLTKHKDHPNWRCLEMIRV